MQTCLVVQKVDKCFLLLVEETVQKKLEEDSIATNICIKNEVQEETSERQFIESQLQEIQIEQKAIHVFLFKYLYT